MRKRAMSLWAGLMLAVAPAYAGGVQSLSGGWARDDGTVRISIAPCGADVCAVNTWVGPTDTKERVGDRLVLALNEAGDGVFKGQAHDVRRQKNYAVTLTLQGKNLSISGCILAGLLCKSAGYSRIN